MGHRHPQRGRPVRHLHAEDLEWHLHARCRGLPTDIFFACEGERGASREAREEYAKRVCRSCVVQHECLCYALVSDEPWGIWGAMTPRERERLSVGRRPTHPPHS